MKRLILWAICCSISIALMAQEKDKALLSESSLSGIKLRSVGPAFVSGRIADIAVHPDNNNIWYVAERWWTKLEEYGLEKVRAYF